MIMGQCMREVLRLLILLSSIALGQTLMPGRSVFRPADWTGDIVDKINKKIPTWGIQRSCSVANPMQIVTLYLLI